MHFSDRLAQVITDKDSCLMLGLDPNWEKLPESFKKGDSLAGKADSYEAFCIDRINQCAPYICGIKIQMGYFEALGSVGVKAVESLIAYTKKNHPELIIMMDAKRGDIGSTSEAYAEAFLGDNSPLAGDCVTVAPYMGFDSVSPFYQKASNHEKAVFILAKTSNPSSKEIQNLKTGWKFMTVAERWADRFQFLSSVYKKDKRYGNYGIVVGATHPKELIKFRKIAPSCWILAPGVGAQGGKLEDVLKIRDADGLGIIIPISRAVLYADDPGANMKDFWETQKMK